MFISDSQIDQMLAACGAMAHPLVKLPTHDQVRALLTAAGGQDRLRDLLAQRDQGIKLMEHDPLRYGYELDWWKDARRLMTTKPHRELLVLGGNDSAKSWLSVKWGVENLVNRPNINWMFLHETEEASINQQQKLVHKFLPPEWRNLGKQGKSVDVCHTDSGGFKNNKFILPNGSCCFFHFYSKEAKTLAGYKLDGACADELIDTATLEELRTRLLGRDGFLLLTFTPAEGFTPPVADFLSGHEVIEWRESRFLPGNNMPNLPGAPRGKMPYILKCRSRIQSAMCVFTEWSPFRKPGDLEAKLENKPTSYVKIRAYGWPEKQQGVAIAKFGSVHIIKRATGAPVPSGCVPSEPWKLIYPKLGMVGTNRRVADPGGNKNWFIKWYRTVPLDGDRCFHYLYREWPAMAEHGEWALPGDKHDGVPGPAMRSGFGRGINDLKRIILEAEGVQWDEDKGWIGTYDDAGLWTPSHGEIIHESWIDPRMGATEVPSEDEPKSLVTLMAEESRDSKGRLIGPSLTWQLAPGGGGSIANQAAIMMLNDWFDYDVQQPVSVLNCPAFYVVEDCEQSIYAYRTYTGLDGEKGILKDVMDPDWYFCKTDPQHWDPVKMKPRGGGSY